MSEQMKQGNTEQAKQNRTVEAVVTSSKMDKTIVVKVERKVKDPRYGKYVRRFSRMYVHDEEGKANEGDLVLIEQCRPLSKLKRWKLKEILKKEIQE